MKLALVLEQWQKLGKLGQNAPCSKRPKEAFYFLVLR
jgi:hypothetical protein